MTRETKLGLLIGTGIILLIGIVVSDHLSVVKKQEPAVLNTFAQDAQDSLAPLPSVNERGAPTHTLDLQQGVDRVGGTKQTRSPEFGFGAPGNSDVPHSGAQPVNPRVLPPSNTLTMGGEPVPAFSTSPVGTSGPAGSSGQSNNNFTAVDHSGNPQIGFFDKPETSSAQDGYVNFPQTGINQSGNGDSVDGLIANRLESLPSRTRETTHQVKSGEALWDIAKHYYGDGNKWELIAGANQKTVGRKGEVRAGTKLTIPDSPGGSAGGSRQAVSADTGLRSSGESSEKTIKVQSGDTLERLARVHLGSGQRWNELFKANADQLRKPEELQIGMILRLPRTEALAERNVSSASQGGNGSARNAGDRTYVVQQGDTLSDIAKKTLGRASRWTEILQANKAVLKNRPQNLKIGQELIIPSNNSFSPVSSNSRGRVNSQQDAIAKLNGDNHRDELLLLEIPTSQPAARPVSPQKS